MRSLSHLAILHAWKASPRLAFRRLSLAIGDRGGLWRALVAGVLGLTLAAGAVGYLLQQRTEALNDAGREMQNVALVMSNWMESDIRTIEFVESGVAEWLRAEGVGTPEAFRDRLASHEAHESLKSRVAGLPRVKRLFLADATGKVIVTSSAWPTDSVSVATREYFQALRDDPKRETIVSGALQSLVDGRWTLYLARRINAADGGFLGVAAAGVELSYFENAFGRLELGQNSTVGLYRRDGMLLARHPHLESRIGTFIPANDPLQRALATSESYTMRRVSPLDGVDRMISAHGLQHYPLYVVATRGVDDLLAPWWRYAKRWGLGVIMLEILLACGVLLVSRLAASRERERAARLREYRTALNAVFDNGTAGLVEVEAPSGRFLRANDRYCEMMGRTEAELMRLTPAEITLAEDKDLLIGQWREALAGAGAGRAEVEARCLRPDGALTWCRVSIAISARDDKGLPTRGLAIVQDVTEARLALERLRASEALLRLGLQAGGIGAFRHDFVAERVECGPETRAMFGLPDDGAPIPMSQWWAIILPEDLQQVRAQIAAISATQSAEGRTNFRIRRPGDGALRHVETRVRCDYAPDGRLLSVIGVLIDVTDAREAEALRKMTLEIGRIGSFRHDFLTDRIVCSPEARAMYGLPADETPLTAAEWWGAILPEDRQALQSRIASRPEGSSVENNARFRVRHLTTGALRHFETRVRLEYGPDGRPVSALGVIIDVTAAQQAEALRRMTLGIGRIGAFRHDFLTDLVECSPEARDIYGLPPGDAPLTAQEWWGAIVPEDLQRLRSTIEANNAVRAGEEIATFRVRHMTTGALRYIESRVRRDYGPDGVPLSALGVIIDVTAAREADALRQLSLEAGRIGAFRHDFVTGLVECSLEARAMYGFPRDAKPLTVEQWWSPILPEDRERLVAEVQAASSEHVAEGIATFRIRHLEDGALRHFEARTRREYDAVGNLLTLLGVVIDVTERREAEARIAHLAHHDALTGLPNRALFRERLEVAMARAHRGHGCAVLLIDLDRFKEVNDTLGHPSGDALLRAAAARLQAAVRDTDTLARLGGDEFAIIESDTNQPQNATALAERIISAIARPFDIDDRQVSVGASLGIALAPSDGLDPDALVKAADMALYRAKADGRGCLRFFESEMDARMQARLALETDLRRALAAEEFEVFFQPIVAVRSRRVSCLEALLRWRHPERGLIPPDAFIPLAEDIGLIVPLGEWVLNQACAEAVTWPGRLRVAVNLSPVQFAHRGLVLAVAAALARTGLEPDRLELEITETVMLHDTEATLAVLEQLKTLGVRIAMDDFGTGYSSLSYLQRFPFDKVKIDRTFTRGLGLSRQSEAIIRAVTGMCAGLDITSTAEGVETEGQLAALFREGCAEAQGFLFSKPLPAAEVLGLLERLDLAA